MPKSTVLEMPPEEHAQRLAVLRRARYGDLRALPILLWCAAGRTPTAIADGLFGSRSRVYRTVRAYRAGTLGLEPDDDGRLRPPVRTTVLVPTRRRSLVALLKAARRAYGWCRTRWSGATLAATLQVKGGITVSAATMRRWVHAVGWVWKRAKLAATDDDPQRVDRLARIRYVFEQLKRREAMVLADELDIHLLPKVGYAWMPKGPQVEVMTPGPNEKHDPAGALDLATGTLHHCRGPRQTNGLFRELLQRVDAVYPAPQFQRVDVVGDNYKIHKAKAVEQWLANPPRFTLLFLPTYWPRATPIERALGDVHDLCTRHHTRKRLRELVADVEAHLHVHGPWHDELSALDSAAAVTAAVEKIAAEEQAKVAA